MAKGRSAGHKGDVSALIGQSHLQINADGDRDEFILTSIMNIKERARLLWLRSTRRLLYRCNYRSLCAEGEAARPRHTWLQA